jgi:hypothetical protein
MVAARTPGTLHACDVLAPLALPPDTQDSHEEQCGA